MFVIVVDVAIVLVVVVDTGMNIFLRPTIWLFTLFLRSDGMSLGVSIFTYSFILILMLLLLLLMLLLLVTCNVVVVVVVVI